MMNTQTKETDLPQFLSLGLPLLALLLIPLAFISPEIFQLVIEYESIRYQEAGALAVLENLTVLLLIPGILAGLVVWFRHRKKILNAWVALWILGWAGALFFFAGEELSWGQWFFHWQTPEWLIEANRQGETNLHNISPWLNQKPRAFVETWIVLAGLILPLHRKMRNQLLLRSEGWFYWVLPSSAVTASAGVFTFFKVCDWLPWPQINQFGTSEIREFAIAIFLMLYMLSIWCRVSAIRQS